MADPGLEAFLDQQVGSNRLEAFVAQQVASTSVEAFVEASLAGQGVPVEARKKAGLWGVRKQFDSPEEAGQWMLQRVQQDAIRNVDVRVSRGPGGLLMIEVQEPAIDTYGRIVGKPILVDGSSDWIIRADGDFWDHFEAADWNPALHPRGPDGQFVERPWNIADDLLEAFDSANDIPPDRILDSVDIPEGISVDGFEQDVDTSEIAQNPEEAADAVLENIQEATDLDNPEKVRQVWLDRFQGGFDDERMDDKTREDLDVMREAVAISQDQNADNEAWQELLESTGVSDEAVVLAPSFANTEGSQDSPKFFRELAQAERAGNTSMVYYTPSGTTSTEQVPPQPGDAVSTSDVATILRHEAAHDMWDEVNSDFRQWFNSEYRDLPEGAITEYADERSEEGFTELVAVATHPDFDPEEFDDDVADLADGVLERLQDPATFEDVEPEGPELPGDHLDVSDVSVGDRVGVMETDTGDVRYGDVVDVSDLGDFQVADVDVGDGTTAGVPDMDDPPRVMFEPEEGTESIELQGDVPEAVDISRSVDQAESDYSTAITIHELDDGSSVFEKQMEQIEDFPYSHPDEHLAEANRSVATSELLEQAGVPVPTHHFEGDRESLLVEGVDGPEVVSSDGTTAIEEGRDVDREAWLDVMAGSVLAGNEDMHGGNFVVDEDGIPQPVDNGLAANEQNEQQLSTMQNVGSGMPGNLGLDVSDEEFGERVQELAQNVDVDELRAGLSDRDVPEHWQQNLVKNVRTAQNLDEPEEDTFEATNLPDLPDDPEVTAPADPGTPVERGGVRAIDGDQPGEEIASQIPNMEERFSEELDPDDDLPTFESKIDPETREQVMDQIARNLDRMREPEFREITAGRISHVDGSGNDNNAGGANVVDYPFFDDDEERGRMSALMVGDEFSASTASHEMQHTVDNSMGYQWGGEHGGQNGGFHEYSTSDPFAETSEHSSSAASAMIKARDDPDGKPIGLDQWADEARSEVQIDADGRPEPLPSDVIEERFMERNPDASLEERYRKFIDEVNRAWFKSQEAYNQGGGQAADSMIKRPYQMTNAGEFAAVFSETMQQDEMRHSFELGNYMEHHPGMIAAWLDLYQPSEDVFEQIKQEARFKGVDI